MPGGRKSTILADRFRETFAWWGSSDHLQKKANSWLNKEIPKPSKCTYEQLIADLHPDQDAYRRFFVDVAAHLLDMVGEKRHPARYLEFGCGNAEEARVLLKQHAALWQGPSIDLEMHFLDIDAKQLKEAREHLSPVLPKGVEAYLWEGDLNGLDAHDFRQFDRLGANRHERSPAYPKSFDLVFAQLVLHEYPLIHLAKIFREIGACLNPSGHFIWSDICYPGIKEYDAIIWNRTLRQIESMEDGPRKEFWYRHYTADAAGYHTRGEIVQALRAAGFDDVEVLQCAYDMAMIVARWPDKER